MGKEKGESPILPKLRFREKLRELRVKSGYTQQQIADILNCSRSTYTYYETGKSSPDLPTLVKLAKILNVSVSDLLEEESGGSSLVADVKTATRSKKNASHIYDLSADEMKLVGYFRAFAPEEKEELLRRLQEKDRPQT